VRHGGDHGTRHAVRFDAGESFTGPLHWSDRPPPLLQSLLVALVVFVCAAARNGLLESPAPLPSLPVDGRALQLATDAVDLATYQTLFDSLNGNNWYTCMNSRTDPCGCTTGVRCVEVDGVQRVTGFQFVDNRAIGVLAYNAFLNFSALAGPVNFGSSKGSRQLNNILVADNLCLDLGKVDCLRTNCSFALSLVKVCPFVSATVLQDAIAFRELQDALGGDSWTECSALTTDPCTDCPTRVTCQNFNPKASSQMQVTKLNLAGNNMIGTMPPASVLFASGALAQLTYFDVSANPGVDDAGSGACLDYPTCVKQTTCFATQFTFCGTTPAPTKDSVVDVLAWQAFYDAMAGAQWTTCAASRNDPCSACPGVTCAPVSPGVRGIVGIALPRNNLNGALPATSLNSLAYLMDFDVSNDGSGGSPNALEGTACFALTRCETGAATCNLDGTGVSVCPLSTQPPTSPPSLSTAAPMAAMQCVTDGGFAPNGTPCAKKWTYNGRTYHGCVDFYQVKPFLNDPTAYLGGHNFTDPATGAIEWCSTIAHYSKARGKNTVKKYWGFCRCGSATVTTGAPTPPLPTLAPVPVATLEPTTADHGGADGKPNTRGAVDDHQTHDARAHAQAHAAAAHACAGARGHARAYYGGADGKPNTPGADDDDQTHNARAHAQAHDARAHAQDDDADHAAHRSRGRGMHDAGWLCGQRHPVRRCVYVPGRPVRGHLRRLRAVPAVPGPEGRQARGRARAHDVVLHRAGVRVGAQQQDEEGLGLVRVPLARAHAAHRPAHRRRVRVRGAHARGDRGAFNAHPGGHQPAHAIAHASRQCRADAPGLYVLAHHHRGAHDVQVAQHACARAANRAHHACAHAVNPWHARAFRSDHGRALDHEQAHHGGAHAQACALGQADHGQTQRHGPSHDGQAHAVANVGRAHGAAYRVRVCRAHVATRRIRDCRARRV